MVCQTNFFLQPEKIIRIEFFGGQDHLGMVWCIEKLRKDVRRYKNVKPCAWNTINKSKHFLLQSKLDINQNLNNDLDSKAQSDSILVEYCKFCQKFPAINKCLLCGELRHRIIFRTTPLVIAKATTYPKMQYYWNIVQQDIQPTLIQFEQEYDQSSPRLNKHLPGQIKTFFKNKIHNGTSDQAKDKKIEYLVQSCTIRQVSARIKAEMLHKQGIAVLNEEYLRNTFPMFTEQEKVEIRKLN